MSVEFCGRSRMNWKGETKIGLEDLVVRKGNYLR